MPKQSKPLRTDRALCASDTYKRVSSLTALVLTTTLTGCALESSEQESLEMQASQVSAPNLKVVEYDALAPAVAQPRAGVSASAVESIFPSPFQVNAPSKSPRIVSRESTSSGLAQRSEGKSRVLGIDKNTLSSEKTSAHEDAAAELSGILNGTIYHWYKHTLLVGVSVLESAALSTTTDTQGAYSFANISAGTYSLNASKTPDAHDLNRTVTSADALAALKIAVGLNPNGDPDGAGPLGPMPVSSYQLISADMNGDGRVTSGDALAILKVAVGLSDSAAPRWVFVADHVPVWSAHQDRNAVYVSNAPTNINYPEQTSVHFAAILVGDVNASWQAPEGSAQLTPESLVAKAELSGAPTSLWGLRDPRDTTAPVITVLGEANVTHEAGTVYSDAGATAEDAVDGGVAVSVTGSVGSASGVYTLTYQAADAAGNIAGATRTVTVQDTQPPVVTLAGASSIEITLGTTFTDPGATALDAADGALSVTVSGAIANAPGVYTLTYTATDAAGNSASVSRSVAVMEPGEFSVLGSSPAQILAQMTLPQKAAQLIQAEISAVSIEDIRRYGLGSVLNGGGSYPNGNRSATPTQWKAYSLALREASLDTQLGSAGIPIVWGTDAVHGHNNVRGATLFPHNIGLGATRNTDLIRQIGLATAAEVAATGIDWIFAPTVAQAKDYRWGRTYESYSDDSALVQSYADAMVLGLQNNGIGATAKHFIGDGGTSRGTDQGNTVLTDAQLIEQHGSGYVGAIGAGVHSVMATFNSVNGVKVHGSEALMNEMLRNQFGFQGMVVSDWNGIEQVPGCSASSCPEAVNAGIDMIMVPYDWKTLHANLIAQVQQGQISQARLDEAVLRVLEFKSALGLLDRDFQVGRGVVSDVVGSEMHRELARQAVRESLVLIKNNAQVLPILPSKRVLLVGAQADSVRHQAGGWSVSWQGDGITNADFPGATTIKQAFDQVLSAGGGVLDYSVNGTYQQVPDVVVVVLAEDPYAEGAGDLQSLDWLSSRSTALQNVQTLRDQGIPVVTLLLSGRPMWMNPEINDSDAFVAAWLPGTEASGISDVLFSDDAGEVRFDFTGRLPFGWPAVAVNPSNDALPVSTFLYERWQGLNYQSAVEMDLLSEDPRSSAVGGGGGGGTNQPVDDLLVFDNGSAEPIWDRGLGAFDGAIGFGTCMNDGGADCPSIEWGTVSDTDRGQVLEIVHPVGAQLAGWFVASSVGVDVSAHTALAFDVKHLEGENNYTMKLDCFYPCTSGDYALGTATQGAWHTFTVPLANLKSQGLNASSVDTGIVIWATNHSGNRYRLDNVRFIGQ